MTTVHFSDNERRARLGLRHLLADGTQVASYAEAAAAMVVLHATDPATVFLEGWARMADPSPESIEDELYEKPTVLRMLAMRRTLFIVPLPDVPIVLAGGSRDVAERERPRTVKMLTDAGIGPDPAAHLAELEEIALAAIREHGEVSTTELRGIDPRLAERMTLARGKSYEGSMAVISRVVHHLALEGRIGRGRPRGSWVSGQFRWSPIERWFPSGIPQRPLEEARAELVRRWLHTFGPATRDDVRWWTGWTVGATRKALDAIGAVEVALDGGAKGYALPDDLEPVQAPAPWVRLLPALDATTMGWTGARLVPRPASVTAVRHQRQRRPDDLGRRPDRRRLGAASQWRGRADAPRGRGRRDDAADRGRGGPPRGMDRAGARDGQLPDTTRDRPPGSRP